MMLYTHNSVSDGVGIGGLLLSLLVMVDIAYSQTAALAERPAAQVHW